MKKSINILFALLLVVALISGCGTSSTSGSGNKPAEASANNGSGNVASEASQEPIRLAHIGPLTGNMADFGQHALNGVQVAVEEINENGGVMGRMLEVVSYDDKNVGEDAAAAAELVISDSSICAVTSAHYSSGVAMVAAPLYQEAGMAAISPSASHPEYSSIGDYIFRNNLTEQAELVYAFQMPTIVDCKKLGIVSMMSDFGESFVHGFEELYEANKDKLGYELAVESFFVDGTVDFAPNVAEIVNGDCDAIIFVAEYNNLAAFAMQYRKVDPDAQIIGLMTCYNPELINMAGEAVEGMVLYSVLNPNSERPAVKNFVDRYVAKFNSQPDFIAANAYDNVHMIAASIEKTGSTDREKIKDALYEVEVTCTAGELKFDANGDAEKTAVMFKVENGDFAEVPDAFKLWDDFVAGL